LQGNHIIRGPFEVNTASKYWPVLCILISLSTFADAILAQEAEPDSYAGFEGRKGEKVKITARPATDRESFRPLIRQQQDQAFSMEAIRESVAALQHTNEFSQVQVPSSSIAVSG
jgi:outer membrane protein assembly factor BamA